MHTEKMKTKFGNDSKDQVIVHKGDRKVFVSYGTPIAEIAGYGEGEVVTLDEDYWDYSATTGQYRNEFLGEGIADTRKKIKDGTYHLTNLVYTDDDWDRVEWKDDMWCPIVSVDLVEDGPINWPNAGAEAAREVEEDTNIKTVILNEFDRQDSEMLSEIVHNSLQDMGIAPASFAFSISVDYTEEDEDEVDASFDAPEAGAELGRQGIHTKTYPNGATYRGHYLNDKRHGVGIKTHADGKQVHCVYEHGVYEGTLRTNIESLIKSLGTVNESP